MRHDQVFDPSTEAELLLADLEIAGQHYDTNGLKLLASGIQCLGQALGLVAYDLGDDLIDGSDQWSELVRGDYAQMGLAVLTMFGESKGEPLSISVEALARISPETHAFDITNAGADAANSYSDRDPSAPPAEGVIRLAKAALIATQVLGEGVPAQLTNAADIMRRFMVGFGWLRQACPRQPLVLNITGSNISIVATNNGR